MSHKNKKTRVISNDVNKPKEKFTKKFFKKEINFFSKLSDKSRKLLSNEPNYIIFLIMTFTLSVMFNEVGLSRTLPFILIIPFLIGTFYGRRKVTILHTVIAAIILGTVCGDAEITATVIIVGTVCTFSGLYLSKYLEQVKKMNIFMKIIKFVFAAVMCVLSFAIYAYYFGMPTDYLKARKAIESQEEVNLDRAVYDGITFNASKGYYEALYTIIKKDGSFEGHYLIAYDARTNNLVFNNEELESLNSEEKIDETNEINEEAKVE